MNRKILFCVPLAMLLSACATKELKDEAVSSLSGNEAYMVLVVDTLDPLHSFKVQGQGKGTTDIKVSYIPPGRTYKVFKVPEGQYCLTRFGVYDLTVTYNDGGFCFFVEQGELNYPGHFVVRDPVTSLEPKQQEFARFMKREYPQLCRQYFAAGCG